MTINTGSSNRYQPEFSKDIQRELPSIPDYSTVNFLDSIPVDSLNNEDAASILKVFKEEIRDPQVLTDGFDSINVELQEIQKNIDDTLDEFFAKQAPNMTPEEKIVALGEVMRAKEIEVKQRLESKMDSLGHGKTAADILRVPFFCLVAGLGFADKVSAHLGPEAVEVFKGSLASIPGLGVFGFGFSCFTLQQKAAAIKGLEEKKEKLVHLAKEESDPVVSANLDKQITSLTLEIQNAKLNLKLEIKETTGKFINDIFSSSHKIMDFVATSDIIDLQSHAIEQQILGATGDVSAVASLVSFGWNLYQIVQNSSHLTRINNKIEELKQTHQKLGPEDVYLAYVVQAKIERLENVKQDYQYQISTKVVNASASTLMFAAGLKVVLIQGGIALGAATVSTLGIASGVGLALVLTGMTMAIGRGVYQNRHSIEHAVKAVSIEGQKMIYKLQLNLAKKSHEAVLEKFNKLRTNLQETDQWQQRIHQKVGELPKITSAKEVQTRMRDLQKQHVQAHVKMDFLMQEFSHNVDEEAYLANKMQLLQTGLEQLAQNKFQIGIEKTLHNEEKNFKKYDVTTLGVVKKVLEEALSNAGEKEKLLAFMHSQGFEAKANLTIDDVLNYIISQR